MEKKEQRLCVAADGLIEAIGREEQDAAVYFRGVTKALREFKEAVGSSGPPASNRRLAVALAMNAGVHVLESVSNGSGREGALHMIGDMFQHGGGFLSVISSRWKTDPALVAKILSR